MKVNTCFKTVRGPVLTLINDVPVPHWTDVKGGIYHCLNGSNDALIEGLPVDGMGHLINGVLFLEVEKCA